MIKLFLFLFPFIAGFFSIFLGSYKISPAAVFNILKGTCLNTAEKTIILDIRVPRIILAAMTGSILSVSGAVLQAIFRNPLVDPYILGISSGAAFGCAITIGFFSKIPVQPVAFLFGVIAVFLTYMVSKISGEISRLSVVLSGIIVTAFFTALLYLIKFFVDPHKLQAIVYWIMGSFSLAEWDSVKKVFFGFIVGTIPVFLMRWRLNVISLGEEEAKSLGIDVKKEMFIFIAFSTFSVAIATSVCGIIGWIGLMTPHIIRMLTGPDHRSLIPFSITFGAALMIIADTISRTISSFDIPVGIITALSGAPFFVYLMKKGKDSWTDA